jgi:hypothetical protein
MSDDFLSRLLATSRSLPVTNPQTLKFLQSIFAGQKPEQEIYQRRPLLSQANPFADFNPPSQRNLFIKGGVPSAAQNTLSDDQENGFSLKDLPPDERKLMLEQVRSGALNLNDFLTRHRSKSLHTNTGDEAEQAFRQMIGHVEPAQAVSRNRTPLPTPVSMTIETPDDKTRSSGSQPTRKGQQQIPQSTSTPDELPVPDDLLKNLAPHEISQVQASKGRASLTTTEEVTLYRQWDEARRQGRISDALVLGDIYEQLFPTGPHWKRIYNQNKRLAPQDARTTKAKGGTIVVPTDIIAQARKQGVSDDEILSKVRDYLSERLGLKPQQVAAYITKYSDHPLGQLLNRETRKPLTVDDMLAVSDNGLFPFFFAPEFLAALEKATTSAESKEGLGAFAANAGRTLAGLPAAIPRYAAMITGALGSDEKDGLSGDLLKFGDALQNSLQPEYLREQAAESADTWSGMTGNAVASIVNSMAGARALNTSKAFSNIKNLLPDKGILSRFSLANTAFGMLQSGGQAFDEAIKARASKEQALTYGLLNALINLSDGIGIERVVNKVALKDFAAQTAKEALFGGVENFGHGFFQGVVSDAVRQLTYDPKSNAFSVDNLIKNLKNATIGSSLGVTTGLIRSSVEGRQNLAENDSNNPGSRVQGNEHLDAYGSDPPALQSSTGALKQFPPTVPFDTNPMRTLPESTGEPPKAPSKAWAREEIAAWRSKEEPRQQAGQKDSPLSTQNPNALQSDAPFTKPPQAGETLIKAPKQFLGTIRINPAIKQALLDVITDLPKPDLRNWAREEFPDNRSNDEARRQAGLQESQRSTDALDALQSETSQSEATTPATIYDGERPLYKAVDIHAQLPEAFKEKTVATVGKFQTLSGWGKNRSSAFTSVDPIDILKYSEQIGHPITRQGALDHGVPGQYYASHAERQAALLHSGLIDIHPKPMCPDCVAWFQAHAKYTKKQWVVRDITNINIFYPDGSLKQIPVKGKAVK